MKICGCKQCRLNGEVNPYDEFEKFLAAKENELQESLEDILSDTFSASELGAMEKSFEMGLKDVIDPSKSPNNIVNRINSHVPFDAHKYWLGISFD